MDRKSLNQRKNELLNKQNAMLTAAESAKRKLTDNEEADFKATELEVADLDQTISRIDAIAKGKSELGQTTTQPVVNVEKKFGAKKQFSAEYEEAFWNQFKNAGRGIYNAALGEGGTTDGGYLVPITVDSTIVPLAPQENSIRELALVIETANDIKLPAQLTKTLAAAKAESRTGNNAFAGTVPSFTQVTLTAYMAGVVVPVTLELAQDVPALMPFLNNDIARGIQNFEENLFINGTGTGQAEGILTGADAGQTAVIDSAGNAALDLVGELRAAYYSNANWLMHRQTGIAFRKKQLSANQFNPYFTSVGRQDYLHGFPVYYSSAMPVYAASPLVNGAIAFGDFKTCMVIGDRGGAGIAVKVLDQTSIKNGVLDVLGYRRTDSRIRVSEAVKIWTVNG